MSKVKKVERIRAFRGSLELFAARCLKIKTKDKKIIPFVFNTAQKYLHKRLEAQLAKTGKVRALVLKGRQQGASTYVSSRYYHKATLWEATNVSIFTHGQKDVVLPFGSVR